MVSPSFTTRYPHLLAPALASRDRRLLDLVTRAISPPDTGYYTFVPRENSPAEFDEQAAFVNDTESKLSIALGGNASGKTLSAAYKTARYVLETPPPRKHCPFWIMGEKFDQICQVAWLEKLSKMIPETEILDIQWHLAKRRWPRAVMLRHPVDRNDCGWILEFRSYEQGVGAIKAVSIGGYWLNEEVPFHQIAEIQARCRDYDSPGWADFTPVECKSQEWPEAYENPPEGWKFYHLNMEKNTAIPAEYVRRYLATIPEDMRETRRIGAFSILRGAVYKEFRKSIHVIDWEKFFQLTGHRFIPRDWRKIRGIDFGYNNPTCCLWIARDHDDHWFVYDEHYGNQQLISHHANKINERGDWPNDPWHGPTYSDHDATWRAELMDHGIKCSLARKQDKNAGITMLRSMMMPSEGDGRPRLYVLSHCENLIREIPGYRWPEGTTGRSPKDEPVDVDNHSLDALRYAIYTDRAKFAKEEGISQAMVKVDPKKHGIQFVRKGG